MHDPGIPPFSFIAGYLFCLIFSCAMILYVHFRLSSGDVPEIPGSIPGYLFGIGVIVLYSSYRLARGLFPAWWQRSGGSMLLQEIVEIDVRV